MSPSKLTAWLQRSTTWNARQIATATILYIVIPGSSLIVVLLATAILGYRGLKRLVKYLRG